MARATENTRQPGGVISDAGTIYFSVSFHYVQRGFRIKYRVQMRFQHHLGPGGRAPHIAHGVARLVNEAVFDSIPLQFRQIHGRTDFRFRMGRSGNERHFFLFLYLCVLVIPKVSQCLLDTFIRKKRGECLRKLHESS